ncbi:MAG: hypothetical protein JW860_14985 [Sedimentisphaerales bacterium]|nr:hypothetical protein [Sedimentisphaerales bacterium]
MKDNEKQFSQFISGIDTQKASPDPQCIAGLRERTCSEFVKSSAGSLKEKQKTAHKIWSIIVNINIKKLTAAAAVIVVGLLIFQFLGKPVPLATISFADIIETMKNVPWLYMEAQGFDGGVEGTGRQWVGFQDKIHAGQWADGKITLWNIKEHKRYTYTPQDRTITIDYTYEDDFPLNLSSPVALLESMNKQLRRQGAQINTSMGKYQGQSAQIQEITLTLEMNKVRHTQTLILYIDPDSNLLRAARAQGTDAEGHTIMAGEITFSYPAGGPADIYELGAPRDAKVISNIPADNIQELMDHYGQSRTEATREYIAIITYTDSYRHDMITMVDIDYKSGLRHRLERHLVFGSGQSMENLWPAYKEQLGQTFESLRQWSLNHYQSTGSISIYLHDGEYYCSAGRDDDGTWHKESRQYDPDPRDYRMPGITLESIAWPLMFAGGTIIEDDYARENNLICIERLQQGMVREWAVSLPARFLFYLDPHKDYISRRKVTEWRADAPWQQNKNWLNEADPTKIPDSTVTVEDMTQLVQAPNGHWYPREILVQQTVLPKDNKDTPPNKPNFKTINIYINTAPVFPDNIFDINHLPAP